MTRKEAECFMALQHWHRVYLRQQFLDILFNHRVVIKLIRKNHGGKKIIIGALMLALLPLLIPFWVVKIIIALIIYPGMLLSSYHVPFSLRAPGERNLKGLHYQFNRHIELPPDLYLKCFDQWIEILYGKDKLPQLSIQGYVSDHYFTQQENTEALDMSIFGLIHAQISNAREELSRELGHY